MKYILLVTIFTFTTSASFAMDYHPSYKMPHNIVQQSQGEIYTIDGQQFERVDVDSHNFECFFNVLGTTREQTVVLLKNSSDDPELRNIMASDILQEFNLRILGVDGLTIKPLENTLKAMGFHEPANPKKLEDFIKKYRAINDARIEPNIKYIHLDNLNRDEKIKYIEKQPEWKETKPLIDIRDNVRKILNRDYGLLIENFRNQDVSQYTHTTFKSNATAKAAYEMYIKDVIGSPTQLSFANITSAKDMASVDAVAYIHNVEIAIWSPAYEYSDTLVLLHSYKPPKATQMINLYYSSINAQLGHFEALVPFYGISSIDYEMEAHRRNKREHVRANGIDHEAFWVSWLNGDFSNLTKDIIAEMSKVDFEQLKNACQNRTVLNAFDDHCEAKNLVDAIGARYKETMANTTFIVIPMF